MAERRRSAAEFTARQATNIGSYRYGPSTMSDFDAPRPCAAVANEEPARVRVGRDVHAAVRRHSRGNHAGYADGGLGRDKRLSTSRCRDRVGPARVSARSRWIADGSRSARRSTAFASGRKDRSSDSANGSLRSGRSEDAAESFAEIVGRVAVEFQVDRNLDRVYIAGPLA